MLDASANRATLSLERPYKDEAGQVIPTLLDITPDGHHVHEPCVPSYRPTSTSPLDLNRCQGQRPRGDSRRELAARLP